MEIRARYDQLKKAEPRIRARDAAKKIGVTEAELVDAGVSLEHSQRLQGPFAALIREFGKLGEVMVLTRNESCVHERTGTYDKIEVEDGAHMGGVYGPEIDLRIFPTRWRYGFATTVLTGRGPRRGFQFFDQHGTAVQKLYLTDNSDDMAYDALVTAWTDHDPDPIVVEPATTPEPTEPGDAEALLEGWSKMQDTHDFFGLLRTHGFTRQQAFHAAEGTFTRRVSAETAETLLNKAAEGEVPIMVFVGSPGVIQIHSGPVNNIKVLGDWLNVLDPRFNLHLRTDHIAEAWIVTKPTRDGDVLSYELLDAEGQAIAMLFGTRKPGIPQSSDWLELVHSL